MIFPASAVISVLRTQPGLNIIARTRFMVPRIDIERPGTYALYSMSGRIELSYLTRSSGPFSRALCGNWSPSSLLRVGSKVPLVTSQPSPELVASVFARKGRLQGASFRLVYLCANGSCEARRHAAQACGAGMRRRHAGE